MDQSVQCPEASSDPIEFSRESAQSINLSDVNTENQESAANSDPFTTNSSFRDMDPREREQELELLFLGDFVPVRPGRFMGRRFIRSGQFIRNTQPSSVVARRFALPGNTRPMRNAADEVMADADGIWDFVNFQRGDGDDGSQASTVTNSPDSAALSVTSSESDWEALDTSD